TFKEALGKLNDPALFEKRSATTSNADIVGISAGSKAVTGNYNVQVFNLAQSSKVALAGVENAEDPLGSGTLTINVGEDSPDIDVTDAHLTDVPAAMTR